MDFENLKKQLEDTTRLTEEIKTEVAHIEWRSREIYTTRRAKLEEFVQQIGTVASTYESWSAKNLVGGQPTLLVDDCMNRLQMLAQLYFPTLLNQTHEFNRAWRAVVQDSVIGWQVLSELNDELFIQAQRQENQRTHKLRYEEALQQRSALEQAVVTSMADVLQFSDEPRRERKT